MGTSVPNPIYPGTPAGVGTFYPSRNPLLNGLVSYWPLNDQSGQRNDAFGTNHLTDNNTVLYDVGKSGNAASFVGVNSEYLSKASFAPPTTGISISLWAYAVADAQYPILAGWCATTQPFLVFASNANVFVRASNGGQIQVVSTGNEFSASSFHHVLAWYDTTDKKARICIDNGTIYATAAGVNSAIDAGDNVFTVGGLVSPVGGLVDFTGRIDEVGIWSRVLTTVEQTALYNAGAGKFYPFA